MNLDKKQILEIIENPEPRIIRERIKNISRTKIRIALQFQYLTACRVSEVCGKWAITGKDFLKTYWQEKPLIVFTIKGAKMNGLPRVIALPLDKEYEPWTKEIYNYFLKRREQDIAWNIFRTTPRTIQNYAKEAFNGLVYNIEDYTIYKKSKVLRHSRNILTHALRHIRATDLMMRYGFDGIDIAVFCGWALGGSKTIGIPKMAKRYIYGQWGRYISKLFVPYN